MTQYAIKHLNEAGFMPPVYAHTKPDARGSEYGFFSATEEGGGAIRVTKTPGNPAERGPYTMLFPTMKDFREWASDET